MGLFGKLFKGPQKSCISPFFVVEYNHKPPETTVKGPISWQRYGNRKSDSPCFYGNAKNVNIMC